MSSSVTGASRFFSRKELVYSARWAVSQMGLPRQSRPITAYYVCKIRNCRFPVSRNLQGFSFRSVCFDQHNITKWNQFLQCCSLYNIFQSFFNISSTATVFALIFPGLAQDQYSLPEQHGIICHMGSCGNNHFFTQSL